MSGFGAVTCVIMAGGRGERMRVSRPGPIKPLVPVGGVPLLEHAVQSLLTAGARRLTVATCAAAPEIAEFAGTRCTALAKAVDARLDVFVERQPLGTIGAARAVGAASGVLVVNADNLTTLDPAQLWQAHLQSGAAMTVATHLHATRIPFAVVEANDGWIAGYREKPVVHHPVASALYALGPIAVAAIEPGERIDAPDLVLRLLAMGQRVATYDHAAPWIDVNDVHALAAAESALATWSGVGPQLTPVVSVVGAALTENERVLLEWRPPTAACYAGLWDTPGGKMEPGETPTAALARELHEELGVQLQSARAVAQFGDRDPTTARLFQHHVFVANVSGRPRACVGQVLAWFDLDTDFDRLAISRPAMETLRSTGLVPS